MENHFFKTKAKTLNEAIEFLNDFLKEKMKDVNSDTSFMFIDKNKDWASYININFFDNSRELKRANYQYIVIKRSENYFFYEPVFLNISSEEPFDVFAIY